MTACLVNLGTPNAPEPGAVRLYLKEFLSDPRVVEIPQLVWQPILRGVILTTRPKKSAHAYRQVWTDEGSPLAVITARQARALDGAFGPEVVVDHAMRYGRPAIAERIDALKAAGCAHILIAPLYPQLRPRPRPPMTGVCCLRRMCAGSRRAHPAALFGRSRLYRGLRRDRICLAGPTERALIASFHGMPERTRARRPYYDHCQRSAAAGAGARLSSRASAAPNGSSPPPTRCWPGFLEKE